MPLRRQSGLAEEATDCALAANLCHHKVLVSNRGLVQKMLLGPQEDRSGKLPLDLFTTDAGTEHGLEIEILFAVEAGLDPAVGLQADTVAHGAEEAGEWIDESDASPGTLNEEAFRRGVRVWIIRDQSVVLLNFRLGDIVAEEFVLPL